MLIRIARILLYCYDYSQWITIGDLILINNSNILLMSVVSISLIKLLCSNSTKILFLSSSAIEKFTHRTNYDRKILAKKDDQKDPFHWCVSWLSLSLLLVHLGDCIWSSYLFIFADILTSEKYQKHTLPSYTRICVCLHSFKRTQLFNRNSYIFALLRELLWKFKDFFLLTFFDEILIICLRRSIVSKFV